ncbi:MAG TPA: hypothetical protein VHL52_09535 [Acidimicrobiia bacterium]|nr:hypothetical protein [Acidimicrobiia bacterium]
MTVQIHAGEVVHSMDHLVLELATPDESTAYFTIYSIGLMRDVGSGRVALLRVTNSEGIIDRCFGESIDLAERMQRRLRGIRSDGGPAPAAGTEHPPLQASIRRLPSVEGNEVWTVASAEHTVSATWSSADPSFWLSASAPAFHPTRDYVTTMTSYRRAELVVDGVTIRGEPHDHSGWIQRLGRPFSSCHAAWAETAIEAV